MAKGKGKEKGVLVLTTVYCLKHTTDPYGSNPLIFAQLLGVPSYKGTKE